MPTNKGNPLTKSSGKKSSTKRKASTKTKSKGSFHGGSAHKPKRGKK